MRKNLTIVIFAAVFTWGNTDFSYILGLRNTHYAFVGVEYADKLGFVVMNSVASQGLEKQYVRGGPFYEWTLPFEIRGAYGIYAGMRYDRVFYDYGASINARWNALHRYLLFYGALQPFYDSDLGDHLGYEFAVECFFTNEVGVFWEIKNMPEFRDVERRTSIGLLFDTGSLYLKPELSMPINNDTHLIRLNVFFVYKNFFRTFDNGTKTEF